MWPETALTRRLGITYPIILAPMAGGPSTPALAAAVSDAGGLGSLGAGYMKPEDIRAAIRETRRLTDRPFEVNLIVPGPTQAADAGDVARAAAALQPYYEELGIAPPASLAGSGEPFEEQLAVVLDERVPVFSFTYGLLPAEAMRAFKAGGVATIGTATTVKEALLLAEAGVDMVVGQGSEAGGHRATFATSPERGMMGTMALIPQLADRAGVPVIAAGGIMDGRGVVAALALGAAGVQMGTAFVSAAESGAHEGYKRSLLDPSDEDATALTRAFSGRPARGRRNRFVEEMAEKPDAVLGYPAQNALTRGLRQAASAQSRTELMSLWSGQGAPRGAVQGAADLLGELVTEAAAALERLHGRAS